MQIQLDLITNMASHHTLTMLVGSLLAVLPVILTLKGYPEKDTTFATKALKAEDGTVTDVVVTDRSRPKTHQAIRVLGFGWGALSAYSGYLTAVTGTQDAATAGLLFLNASLLMSRAASKYKWSLPAAAGIGGVVWVRLLQILNAAPPAYVSVVGWGFITFPLFLVSMYAERIVKVVGDVMTLSPATAAVGATTAIQGVLLMGGGTLQDVPPIVWQFILNYLTQFGGG